MRTASKSSRMASLPTELSSLPGQCLPAIAPRFRLRPRQPVSLAAAFVPAIGTDRNSAHATVQNRGTDPSNGSLHPCPPGQRLALSKSLPIRRAHLQLFLVRFSSSAEQLFGSAGRSRARKAFACLEDGTANPCRARNPGTMRFLLLCHPSYATILSLMN